MLKLAAIKLSYSEIKIIEIKDINTHSLTSRCGKYTTFGRIQRQGNTKNESMAVIYIQGIHIIPIALILQRHINGHEISTKFVCVEGGMLWTITRETMSDPPA